MLEDIETYDNLSKQCFVQDGPTETSSQGAPVKAWRNNQSGKQAIYVVTIDGEVACITQWWTIAANVKEMLCHG
jgi:hypothetical protein